MLNQRLTVEIDDVIPEMTMTVNIRGVRGFNLRMRILRAWLFVAHLIIPKKWKIEIECHEQ